MARRTRRLLLLTLAGVVAVTLAFCLSALGPSGYEALEMGPVRHGMTLAEVEEALGARADARREIDGTVRLAHFRRGQDGEINVFFDEAGTVSAVRVRDFRPTLCDRVRRGLGL
jgi:hypothetical protein